MLEICVDSVASAIAAQGGGAARVELCDNLIEGGTTPSYGMIKAVRAKVNIGLMVMIRPRGGDFLYSKDEFELMKTDIQVAKDLGADGVVFGLLLEEGIIDMRRTQELLELARPMKVTFHRAFDMVENYSQSLENLVSVGMDCILTSGLHANVMMGKEVIKKMVEQAAGRICIMAGGGVRLDTMNTLLAYTGVPAIHASGRKSIDSPMKFRNAKVEMGAIAGSEYTIKVADESTINRFKELMDTI